MKTTPATPLTSPAFPSLPFFLYFVLLLLCKKEVGSGGRGQAVGGAGRWAEPRPFRLDCFVPASFELMAPDTGEGWGVGVGVGMGGVAAVGSYL